MDETRKAKKREYMQKWRANHPEYRHQQYLSTRERATMLSRKWDAEHRERKIELKHRWVERNRERIREQARQRTKSDTQFRLGRNLRMRLNDALRGRVKVGSAVADLGCSISELKAYLERLWTSGMSWNNYGTKGWHIDHIVPMSSVDLTDREQLLRVCHYTNLQPLWAGDNFRKSNKILTNDRIQPKIIPQNGLSMLSVTPIWATDTSKSTEDLTPNKSIGYN